MRYKFFALQSQDTPKLIQKAEPLDLNELYNIAVNWILINGPRILFAIVVLIAGQWLIRVFRRWLQKALLRKKLHSAVRPFLVSLVDITVQILLFLLVMQIMGVQLTLFAAIIASFGVALGLALSGTLQNFTGGLLILFLKPFKVGDRIIAQGQEGIVESIQIFYTVVKANNDRTVIIPNSKLSNEVIIRFQDAAGAKTDVNRPA